MQKFTKYISLFLALLLMVGLIAGCGNNTPTDSDVISDGVDEGVSDTASDDDTDASTDEEDASTDETGGDDTSADASDDETGGDDATGNTSSAGTGNVTSGGNNNATTAPGNKAPTTIKKPGGNNVTSIVPGNKVTTTAKKPGGNNVTSAVPGNKVTTKVTTKVATTTKKKDGSGVGAPSSDKEKWGTEAGTTNVKKVPAWMKKIKSGEVFVLGSTAYGEGVENDAYRNEKATFKALTGKDLKVKTKVVEWNSLSSTLQTMVLAGDAPDLFTIYNGVGTYLRNKNITRDIRDYINMNDAAWKGMQKLSEPLFYDNVLTGVCATEPLISYGIMYNKTLINQAGLDDPFELYKKGKWDIAKFLEYVEELTVDKNHDNNPEVFGVSLYYESIFRMSSASGMDMVTINNDGTVTNNLRHANFTRWASYARKVNEVGSYDSEPWTAGTRFWQNKVAMMTAGWTALKDSDKAIEWHKSGKLGWVPSPKDVNANKHYHAAEATYAFLPKNSKNPEGGAAYLYMQRYSALNPSASVTSKEKAKYLGEYGFTEEEYNYYMNINKGNFSNKNLNLEPIMLNWQHIPDFSYYDLAGVYTQDWNVLVEWAYPSLQAAIDKQNK